MLKVLILQAMHSLSDGRAEFLIRDRLFFIWFLGLGLADPVPDANTIWTFREALKMAIREGRNSMNGAAFRLWRRFKLDISLNSQPPNQEIRLASFWGA